MGDGLLSQDDIDALTKGLAGGSSPAAAPGPEIDAAKKLLRLLSEQASSVVSTVLSRSVDFRAGNVVPIAELGTLSPDLVNNGLVLGSNFRKELNGKLSLAIEKKTVAILADLMLMGAGTVEYSDDHKDAIQEIMNQIMGSSSTTLSNEIGISAEISQTGTENISSSDPFAGFQLGCEVKLSIEGFPEQKVYWLIEETLVKSLKASKLNDASSSSIETSLASLGLGGGSSAAPSVPLSAPTAGMDSSAQRSAGGQIGAFGSTGNKALDLLMDIELPISIELGRTHLSLKRILELGPGAIVEMERFAGEPVDILINGKIVAKGEVVVVDENFGVRLVSLVTPEERIKMLR